MEFNYCHSKKDQEELSQTVKALKDLCIHLAVATTSSLKNQIICNFHSKTMSADKSEYKNNILMMTERQNLMIFTG